MGNLPLSFLTVQQIADRWNMDILDVHQLILTGQLPQSFLLSGLATIARYRPDLSKEIHPLCQISPSAIRVLTRSISGTQRSTWALTDVLQVYECAAEGVDQVQTLRHLCFEEQHSGAGWTLFFDPDSLQVAGADSFQLALKALRDTTIIPTTAIAEFERRNNAPSASSVAEQCQPPRGQDPRRQRCRVAAQMIWERNEKVTISDLYHDECIRRIACEGRLPTEKTFREWVKDLNPDRSPGRRKVA